MRNPELPLAGTLAPLVHPLRCSGGKQVNKNSRCACWAVQNSATYSSQHLGMMVVLVQERLYANSNHTGLDTETMSDQVILHLERGRCTPAATPANARQRINISREMLPSKCQRKALTK